MEKSTDRILKASICNLVIIFMILVLAGCGGNVTPSITDTGNVPALPANVAATDGASGSNIYITWTPQSDAISYNVYRSDACDGEYVKINRYPVATAEYANSLIGSGVTYFYKITAVNDNGESLMSACDEGHTDVVVQIPARPTGVEASDGISIPITVKWIASARAASYNVYKVFPAGWRICIYCSIYYRHNLL